MCTVSMIGDHYKEKWTNPSNPFYTFTTTGVCSCKEELEALKKEVLEMKALLKRALKYDEENGEPDCHMDEKVDLLKKVAKLVDIDLEEVFGKSKTKKKN